MDIQAELRKMLGDPSAQHKRLIEYVVRQVGTGRHMKDVLDDAYITNRTRDLDRRALLDEPEIVEAVAADVLGRLRAQIDALLVD